MTKEARPVNLALQGGGSHGALAWGVLDRLLQEPGLRIAEISGTSAGAMNAVVLAHGLEQGGPEGARAALAGFWKAVSEAARFSPMRPSFWDRMLGDFSLDRSPGYLMAETLSRMFSPYELNPLDLNPLRDLLAERVDFTAINRSAQLRVHVNATNVRTGLSTVFSTGKLSCDTVMASACLPLMYRAVEIDGEAYWDGGYSANPALMPLILDSDVEDVLIVQLNPLRRERLPRNAREILNRINEISFNTSLVKELRGLAELTRLIDEGVVTMREGAGFRLHMIHCEESVQDMASSSKLNAEWGYLEHLFGRGRIWAERWLAQHRDDIGKRTTFRIEEVVGSDRITACQQKAG